jgi:hypothetical protein
MAMSTMQHWSDLDRGLAELVRVARGRIVLLTIDAEIGAETSLPRDYLPEIAEADRRDFPPIAGLVGRLGPGTRVVTLPVAADFTDCFALALWSRPQSPLEGGPGRHQRLRPGRPATPGLASVD